MHYVLAAGEQMELCFYPKVHLQASSPTETATITSALEERHLSAVLLQSGAAAAADDDADDNDDDGKCSVTCGP